MKRKLLIGFIAILLSACASIPLTTLPKLAGLNFETVDMSKIELAVRIQESVGIQKGTAKLKFDLENPKFKHAMTLDEPNTMLSPYLKRQEKPNYKIYRFEISPEQYELAEAFRAKVLEAKKKTKGKTRMSLNATVGFCQFEKGPVLETIKMTFFLKTAKDRDFYTLIKEQDISFTPEDIEEMKLKPIFCSDQ